MQYTDYASSVLGRTSLDQSLRQMWYLNCAELQYYLTANSEFPMRSEKLNTDWFEKYCQRIFLSTFDDKKDKKGDLVVGTNILFTNGSEDPW